MRVFVSSVIAGFEEYRAAAMEAAQVLRHDVIRAEDFPAMAATPQQACLAGVREADVAVILLGSRYGQRHASGKSATEEEFDEAIRSKPVLVFSQLGVDRDDDMADFVQRVQNWAGGSLTATFSSPEQLRDRVIAALAEHALREQAGRIDDAELEQRARATIPSDRNVAGDLLVVAVAGGPTQQILRPAEIEDSQLCEDLKREAMFGSSRVIDSDLGARCELRGDALVVANDKQQLIVDPLGTIAITGPTRRDRRFSGGLSPIIEEDITDTIATALRFIGTAWDRIDPTTRLAVAAPEVALLGGGVGWQTRAEHEANPNRMSGGLGSTRDRGAITLTPITRPRPHLSRNALELAQDFTVLLRRQVLG